MWPFTRKKDSSLRIKDGRILSDADPPEAKPVDVQAAAETCELGRTMMEEPTEAAPDPEDTAPAPAPPPEPIRYPLAEPIYQPSPSPSFLIDDPDGGDLDLYQDYLHLHAKKRRTKEQYVINLRLWKRELAGAWPTAELVQRIIGRYKPHRAHQMLTALRAYAKYRNLHGDSRLAVMFAIAVDLKSPQLPAAKKREILTQEQVGMYRSSARDLAGDGNRAGIWIGLSLLGVRADEVRHVQLNGGKHILIQGEVEDETKSIPAPDWLIQAMRNIPRWRLVGNTIRKEMRKYGCTPHLLLLSARHNSKPASGSGGGRAAHPG